MFKKAFALTLILSACVDQPEVDIESTAKLAGNSLTPAMIVAASLDSTVLDADNLHAMAATADGRDILVYTIGCALAQGHDVSTTYDPGDGSSQSITFRGAIGLADTWTSADLTTAAQHHISGCLLARANLTGAINTISIRGMLPQYAVVSGEATTYNKFEGVFFGNVFAGSDHGVAACRGTSTTFLPGRTCTVDAGGGVTQCGFAYAGLCTNVCTFQSNGANSYYTNCVSGGNTFLETSTVFTN
jgi:hypothetical protein